MTSQWRLHFQWKVSDSFLFMTPGKQDTSNIKKIKKEEALAESGGVRCKYDTFPTQPPGRSGNEFPRPQEPVIRCMIVGFQAGIPTESQPCQQPNCRQHQMYQHQDLKNNFGSIISNDHGLWNHFLRSRIKSWVISYLIKSKNRSYHIISSNHNTVP